jgi:hypothetical protein
MSPTPKDISYKIKFLEEKCRDDFSKVSTQNTYQKSDTFKDKHDRIQLEHKAKLPEMNHKIRKPTGNKIEQECWRLRATIDEKNKEFEKLRKEMDKLNRELKLFKDKRPIHFFKHQEKPSNNPYKHIRTQSDRFAFTDRNNREQVESRTNNLEIDTLKRTLSSSHMKKISESKVQLKRKQPVASHNRSSSDTFRKALHSKIL